IASRKTTQFLFQGPPKLLQKMVVLRGCRIVVLTWSLTSSSARGGRSGPECDSATHAVQPGAQRVTHVDRIRLSDQDQKRGLKGPLGLVRAGQKPTATAQDHRPMAREQGAKRCIGPEPLAMVGPNPLQQLTVGRPDGRARREERLEIFADGARMAT